jgi:hypothetical protein
MTSNQMVQTARQGNNLQTGNLNQKVIYLPALEEKKHTVKLPVSISGTVTFLESFQKILLIRYRYKVGTGTLYPAFLHLIFYAVSMLVMLPIRELMCKRC